VVVKTPICACLGSVVYVLEKWLPAEKFRELKKLLGKNMPHDLLVQVRNAQRARKRTLRMPFSNLDFAVAKVLVANHYLKDARKKVVEKKAFLEIDFPKDPAQYLQGFRFWSTPGRRVYRGYRSLRSIRQGYGIGVLSTSQGVMTIADAKKQKLGGEYLFEAW